MNGRALARMLSEVARAASESIELQGVFDRVATSVRQLIPFDHMGVVRILDGRWAELHATTAARGGGSRVCGAARPLTSWSPRLRPRPGPISRVDDALAELDPAFPADALLLEHGVRASLWEPFQSGGLFTGGVWLSAFRPRAFDEQHQELLRPVAALLGSAVEHWRIWDAERRRRERLDQLEEQLGALAESLDVRAVFERLSESVQRALPHDLLVLSERDRRARSLRLVAVAGPAGAAAPDPPVPLSDGEPDAPPPDGFELVRDLSAEGSSGATRARQIATDGMRSMLSVPVGLGGELHGSLAFLHRDVSRYGVEDVEVAARIADRIALALSHQRLADEARAAAEAREHAERLEAAVLSLTSALEARERRQVVGVSASWRAVLAQVSRVASSETTVLLTGESGTGKEVVARLVHHGSPRSARPFVAINCAALPEQLLESELFGHERGAYTGAIATTAGKLEQAGGGTLFLDEVAEMSPLVQAKLLRVLEEREFQRLGGSRTLRADVRVIAATNRDLAVAIAQGRFREDLYYRLNVFHLHLPPLRERVEDILPLAESFLEELAPTMPRPAAGISRQAREWLLAYPWPGNARELRNAVERAILLCDGGLITCEHLPAAVGQPRSAPGVGGNGWLDREAPLPAGGVNLDDVERSFVERALRDTRGNKARAARLLGLTRAQLYSRLEKYSIQ